MNASLFSLVAVGPEDIESTGEGLSHESESRLERGSGTQNQKTRGGPEAQESLSRLVHLTTPHQTLDRFPLNRGRSLLALLHESNGIKFLFNPSD